MRISWGLILADIISISWDGQRISRPGIYANIPLADYHRGDICDGPSLSSSGLRLLWAKSPKHFWDKSALNPERAVEDEENHDFILGRAAHHLICGEIGFANLFSIRPTRAPERNPCHGNNRSGQKWMTDQRSLGKSILSIADAIAIKGMAVSIHRHPF